MTKLPAALLVIDVQRGLFSRPIPVFEADRMLVVIGSLVQRAHAARAPVIYLRHQSQALLPKGSPSWQLHPALKPRRNEFVLNKAHPSAFQGTALTTVLEDHAVRRLVVTGLVTQGCVRATVLDALQRGFVVDVARDGHSTFHRHAGKMIQEWNNRLASAGAHVRPASAIRF